MAPEPTTERGSTHIWRTQTLRILLPAFLAAALFWAAFFLLVRPGMHRALVQSRRQNLQEIMEVATDELAILNKRVVRDEISPDSARRRGLEYLSHLQYGPFDKDYFWVHGTDGTMLMHPLLPELEGTDVNTYQDVRGKYFAREMQRLAMSQGAGFVDYYWPYPADTSRVERKVSYVRLFEPWGWIVGTGMYLTDVYEELDAFTMRLNLTAGTIILLVTITILYLARLSFISEKKREAYDLQLIEMNRELREILERYNRLKGLLPICAGCKKVRDDRGYWQDVELFVGRHSEAQFTHGLCPTCKAEYMKELRDQKG